MSLTEKAVSWQQSRHPLRWLSSPLLSLLGISFPPQVRVGKGLRLPHGAVGLVVHQDTVINDNVTLYQNVTLGRSDTYLSSALSSPGGNIIIGDDVIIGAGAVVLFRSGCTLEIGKGSVVGANSVVIGNIPQGEIWAGNPAKFIRTRPLN